jgi:ABC-type proline/glycine betaine transport system permease subunit
VIAGTRYLWGFGLVAACGAGLAAAADPAIRSDIAWGVLLGVLIQAPLGWWTVRSIGTERFQAVWVLGMLTRLVLVAVTGLFLVPVFGWNLIPALGALVGVLLLLLVVEVMTALREQAGVNAR